MPDPTSKRSAESAAGSSSSSGSVVLLFVVAMGMLTLPLFILAGISIWRSSDSAATPTSSSGSTAQVTLSEFAIDAPSTVAAGDVSFVVSNAGSAEHNLIVEEAGVRTANISSGATATLDVASLSPGEYELWCDIAGHREAGMVTSLTVTDDEAEIAALASAAQAGGDDEPDYAEMDRAMTESILAFPAATEGLGNPILDPTEILDDGTKVFDLTAEIVEWEVEPGRFVEAWTYNGVVPAPQILLDQGDNVQVRVVNNLPMGTDIHWHGVRTPNDQDGVAPITQDLIPPDGGTFTYEFVADEAAIGMYHAHNHAQIQVIRGMFGVIRIGDNPIPRGMTISGVEIPDDLELALDMPMVLNDAGTIGFSLNGKSFPATEPVVLDQGDWVSVTYYNEGLQIHPMHLHQFPQLVYAKDGVPLDEPYWADTINVSPGERYTVMFRADDVGTWVWHCHILTHVEREEGMFGMVTAIVVNEVPGFDPEAEPVRPTDFLLTPATADADADHDHG
ncbi:MAG: multicopper oxidase domain-containing protein [Acidimicrobiia bacterium]|nr:multicopper oxidase domain-containing protein [Acidimicrobiia bacterium]